MLRLKDVADVELGTQTYSFSSEMDGKPAVMFIVFQDVYKRQLYDKDEARCLSYSLPNLYNIGR